MRTTRRSTKFAALAVGLSLIVAACGDDDDTADTTATTTDGTTATTTAGTTADTTEDTTEVTTDDTTEVTTDDTTEDTTDDTSPSGEAAMRVTYQLNPDAVWDDGTPITSADFECSWQAHVNTPGSIETTGYDQILSVEEGASAQEVIVEFGTIYAPYRGLFSGLLKAEAFEDCNDVSEAFDGTIPFSGTEWVIESWSNDQLVYAPNPNNWYREDPVTERVVVVPMADQETEIGALLSGQVDFIYPQFFQGIEESLADPNVAVEVTFGGDYEALYFQQLDGPFADDVYREAFAKSIDRDALFEQIYRPLVAEGEVLTCGPIVPGPFCAEDAFTDTYDPEAAVTLLEGAGWTKNADGMWQNPDGEVPEVRWMVNTGNTRRESTQAYLIPLLAEAGFNVVPDNCEALPCVFETRLPSLDYDLGMYISTAPPDPAYLTPSFTCANIPTEENDFKGQNQQGWCNEEASAALEEADRTIDLDERAELIKTAQRLMAEDTVLIPLFQFPKSGAYRTDKLGGPVADELTNYAAFNNFSEWEDLDGDGQIVIGAEQFPTPECANPITECANSSWYVWVVAFPLLPGVYRTTNEGTYEITRLVTEEPVVEVL